LEGRCGGCQTTRTGQDVHMHHHYTGTQPGARIASRCTKHHSHDTDGGGYVSTDVDLFQ
jgi:hypothetical protein